MEICELSRYNMMDFEDMKVDKEIVITQRDRDDWTNP
jgi:hypothetical protein